MQKFRTVTQINKQKMEEEAANVLVDMKVKKCVHAMHITVAPRIRTFVIRILKFMLDRLEHNEAEIRLKFGNNPDVSKALRCMWKAGCVTKTGTGGRLCPYVYQYV